MVIFKLKKSSVLSKLTHLKNYLSSYVFQISDSEKDPIDLDLNLVSIVLASIDAQISRSKRVEAQELQTLLLIHLLIKNAFGFKKLDDKKSQIRGLIVDLIKKKFDGLIKSICAKQSKIFNIEIDYCFERGLFFAKKFKKETEHEFVFLPANHSQNMSEDTLKKYLNQFSGDDSGQPQSQKVYSFLLLDKNSFLQQISEFNDKPRKSHVI